jgi:hypothetical protein
MILTFFAATGWASWDVTCRPLIPERMPVLVDDDLRFEDGAGAPRATVVVNRWLRGCRPAACRRRARGPATPGR